MGRPPPGCFLNPISGVCRDPPDEWTPKRGPRRTARAGWGRALGAIRKGARAVLGPRTFFSFVDLRRGIAPYTIGGRVTKKSPIFAPSSVAGRQRKGALRGLSSVGHAFFRVVFTPGMARAAAVWFDFGPQVATARFTTKLVAGPPSATCFGATSPAPEETGAFCVGEDGARRRQGERRSRDPGLGPAGALKGNVVGRTSRRGRLPGRWLVGRAAKSGRRAARRSGVDWPEWIDGCGPRC